MGEASARLGLPFLAVAQAQKEGTHNEALAMLDLGLHPAVEAVGTNAPPADPAGGQCWVVGTAPTGAWSGHARALAGWTGGGWRFVPAVDGMTAWVRDQGVEARFAGGGWVVGDVAARRVLVAGLPVLGERRPAIAAPAGGPVVDAEARATLSQLLSALRAHGLIAT